MKVNKAIKIDNVKIGTYGRYESLDERDHRICDEDGVRYKPSGVTKIVKKYLDGTNVKTDFNSLIALAKELDDVYGLSLIIEPNGTLLIYNTDY